MPDQAESLSEKESDPLGQNLPPKASKGSDPFAARLLRKNFDLILDIANSACRPCRMLSLVAFGEGADMAAEDHLAVGGLDMDMPGIDRVAPCKTGPQTRIRFEIRSTPLIVRMLSCASCFK